MPVYAYKGLADDGREVKGLQDAESPKGLRTTLKKQGIRIVEHREEASKIGGLQLSGSTEIDLKKYFERVTVADVALVTRQLATLLRSGITLIDALTAIVEQLDNEKFKRIFGAIKTGVNEGSSLADAMAEHPATFDELYISMVRAGEASGALDKVLVRLADFTEAQAKLKSKIMGALLYPLIMLGVGSVIMVVLFVVVIPRITKIFQQVKADLPPQTRLLIFVADVIRNYWWLLVPLVAGSIFYFFRWKKSKKGRPKWDRFTLRVPVLGPVVRLVAIARFSRTLATLLRSGVPVLTALDITKDVLNNLRLAEVVTEAREAIREGESISTPLRKSKEFPPIVVHMVATGEKSGQLEEMLEHVADNYDFQVDQKVERLTTLIEPIMIVGMGGAVAFIVFSILMPILQLSQHVR
ncbi:MAG: type II secretion system inner membrane protein GspF [Deltaproteobacteria bacterium]|jgi:general secretion pathway protein F|nr:type II secretion system inner membrane protein GspF [Deltaproteobacteria bacterium]